MSGTAKNPYPDSFADWTCLDCGRTFTPLPDDSNSFPVGVRYEDKMIAGILQRVVIGKVCSDCMGESNPGAKK